MVDVITSPKFTMPSEEERAALAIQLEPELKWHEGSVRYADELAIQRAISLGELVEFKQSSDIARIRGFDYCRTTSQLPFLHPVAHQVVSMLGHKWREILEEDYGIISPNTRLSISSMVRSQQYQDIIVAAGKLAHPNSTHCTGYAFDIDASGYYSLNQGQLLPVIDPKRQVSVEDQIDGYDARINAAALGAARILQQEGVINLVPEFSGSANACLHISCNPHLQAA
ncbi:MAG: DUF5715 family protein [Candidatus Saccharimonadales bacterium]